MKQSQDFKLKLRIPAILKAPFLRRKKSKIGPVCSNDFLESDSPVDIRHSGGDDTASPQLLLVEGASNTSGEAASHQGLTSRMQVQDLDVPSSPSPTNKSFRRQSISRMATSSGENVRVSMTVDTIKQQVNDGLQMLAEFRKSLRPSSDVQRYNEAVGTLESAAKDLTILKTKLSNRKLGLGDAGSRISYTLPPPESLKLEIEETPFTCGIPGMESEEMTYQSQSHTTPITTTTPTTITTFTVTSPLTAIKEKENEREVLEPVQEHYGKEELDVNFTFPGEEERGVKAEGLAI